jgi:DNA-binding transcriptional MerR regulator
MDHFFVTEAAKKLGIHPSTLRDLENRGMIQVQRNWSGWRVYSEGQIQDLKRILYPGSGDAGGKASKP